jgi:hypothetical protein
MTPSRHFCDAACFCPIDGLPLFYARSVDEHACFDIKCKYGHGGLFI